MKAAMFVAPYLEYRVRVSRRSNEDTGFSYGRATCSVDVQINGTSATAQGLKCGHDVMPGRRAGRHEPGLSPRSGSNSS
jgi:hypothetical protein